MDAYLNTLKNLEKELVTELQRTPLFRKLESLRSTIKDFEANSGFDAYEPALYTNTPITPKNAGIEGKDQFPVNNKVYIPAKYDPSQMTWRTRILYIVHKTPMLGMAEIIKEVQRLEPDAYDKKFLDKRIGVTVSSLKSDKYIDAKVEDGRFKYFIKNK